MPSFVQASVPDSRLVTITVSDKVVAIFSDGTTGHLVLSVDQAASIIEAMGRSIFGLLVSQASAVHSIVYSTGSVRSASGSYLTDDLSKIANVAATEEEAREAAKVVLNDDNVVRIAGTMTIAP
jgi:hypothetical protein